MVALLLTATAAVAGLFTPKQVAAGMPAGAVIFGNTQPVCVLDADGSTYPLHPRHHAAVRFDRAQAARGQPDCGQAGRVRRRSTDYTGYKEPIGIGGVVAGGCLGRSADGLSWDCYIGQDAVDQLIISQDFLGEPMLGPGRG